jgi:hypothetical protein
MEGFEYAWIIQYRLDFRLRSFFALLSRRTVPMKVERCMHCIGVHCSNAREKTSFIELRLYIDNAN